MNNLIFPGQFMICLIGLILFIDGHTVTKWEDFQCNIHVYASHYCVGRPHFSWQIKKSDHQSESLKKTTTHLFRPRSLRTTGSCSWLLCSSKRKCFKAEGNQSLHHIRHKMNLKYVRRLKKVKPVIQVLPLVKSRQPPTASSLKQDKMSPQNSKTSTTMTSEAKTTTVEFMQESSSEATENEFLTSTEDATRNEQILTESTTDNLSEEDLVHKSLTPLSSTEAAEINEQISETEAKVELFTEFETLTLPPPTEKISEDSKDKENEELSQNQVSYKNPVDLYNNKNPLKSDLENPLANKTRENNHESSEVDLINYNKKPACVTSTASPEAREDESRHISEMNEALNETIRENKYSSQGWRYKLQSILRRLAKKKKDLSTTSSKLLPSTQRPPRPVATSSNTYTDEVKRGQTSTASPSSTTTQQGYYRATPLVTQSWPPTEVPRLQDFEISQRNSKITPLGIVLAVSGAVMTVLLSLAFKWRRRAFYDVGNSKQKGLKSQYLAVKFIALGQNDGTSHTEHGR